MCVMKQLTPLMHVWHINKQSCDTVEAHSCVDNSKIHL